MSWLDEIHKNNPFEAQAQKIRENAGSWKFQFTLTIYYSKKKERLCVMMCQHFFDQIVLFNPFQFDEKNLESILRAKKKSDFSNFNGFLQRFVHQQFETKTENLNSGPSKINKIRHEFFSSKWKILNCLLHS